MKKKLIIAIFTISICFISGINKVNANEYNFSSLEKQYIEELYGSDYEFSKEEYEWIKKLEIDKSGYRIVTNEQNIIPYIEINETDMKILKISQSNDCITVAVSWKKEAQVKNYDVIAARFSGLTLNRSYYSSYITTKSSKYKCQNYKLYDNGIGCSFKLPQSVKNVTIALYFKTNGSGTVYATYQHSKTNRLTLNDSKNYSLSANGYGKVLQFNNKVAPYYDNMRGVEINI